MQRVLVFLLILWPAWASAQVAPRPAPTPRAILRAAPLPPSVGTRWRAQQRSNAASPLGMWTPPEGYNPPPVRLVPPPVNTSIGRPGELPPSQRTLIQAPNLRQELARVAEADARDIAAAHRAPPSVQAVRTTLQQLYGPQAAEQHLGGVLAEVREADALHARHREGEHARLEALAARLRNPTLQRPPTTPTFTNVPVTSNARPLRELVSGMNPAGPDGVRPCPGGAGCRNIVVQRMQGELGHRTATATIGACRLGLGCQSSHTTVGLRAASGNARSEAQATIGPDAGYAIGHGSGSGTISGGRRSLLDATVRRITETTPGVPHNVGAALRATMQEAHGDNAPPVVQTPISQRRGHQ